LRAVIRLGRLPEILSRRFGIALTAAKGTSRYEKNGFLSFGYWTPSPQSQTQTAADALLQSIDPAVEAERIGMDGAYFAFIISLGNWRHRFRCSRRSALKRKKMRLAPP
jgi:hypothetical protein